MTSSARFPGILGLLHLIHCKCGRFNNVRFVAREAYDSCDLESHDSIACQHIENSLEAVRRLTFNAMRHLMRAVGADELQLQLHQGRICLRYMIKEGESMPVITAAAVLMPLVTLHEVTENQINSRRDLLDTFSETATTTASFVAPIRSVWQSFIRARDRRRIAGATYMALHKLDAHTLRDIGLHPSEIGSVAAEFAGDE